MGEQVLLIGLDGATFTLLDPLMSLGIMPFLKTFVETGVRAHLLSTIPPLTPPAWTSMLTGRSPGYHGIFDFFQPHAPGSKQITLATTRDLRVDTIGTIANQNGKRVSLLNFPMTFPPPKLEGNVIAGWMPWRQLRLGCHPGPLYDQIKKIPGFNPKELAMDMALEAKATEGAEEDEYKEWVALHVRRDQQWLKVLRFLFEEDPCELTAVLLDGPDKIQHLCWRFLDPDLWPAQPTAYEREIRDLCLGYYSHLDQVIAEMVTLAGPDTNVIIASDHGFGPTYEVFYVNAWLAEAGYLSWVEDVSITKDQPSILGMNHLARHMQWIDWDKTTAYASTPTSNGIHILTAENHQGKGVPAEKYEAFRNELVERLYQVIDPLTGEQIISRVWQRDEIFPGPAGVVAPDLTLTLRDGGLVSILPADQFLKPRSVIGGTHRPEGVFIARGPGIYQGKSIAELSILDVAPAVMYLLNGWIPDGLEGNLPQEMFRPAYLSQKPVKVLTSNHTGPGAEAGPSAEAAYDEKAEAAILSRLRDLGYIE